MLTLSAPAPMTSYKCGLFSCAGTSPEATVTLIQLQRLANDAAAKLGITDRIVPDGKIGSKTVDLIQLIAVQLADDQTSMIKDLWAASKEEITQSAPAILDELRRVAEAGPSPGPRLPTPAGSTPPVIRIRPGLTIDANGSLAPTTPGLTVFVPTVKTPYVAAGIAAGVAAIVGGVAFALHKRRGPSTAMAGARPRKTRDEYRIEVNYGYGHGWEHEISEDSRTEGKKRLAEYRANAPQYPVRMVKRRVKI